MVLTKKLLQELEESRWIRLTREQRAILFLWYGSESEHEWSEEDFVFGIRNVQRYYPDHRPKPVPDFLRNADSPDDEPF